MKTTLVGIIAFLMLTPFASAKNKEVETCGKQVQPLAISGHFQDWKLPVKFDKSTGYYYGMTNDDQNLYLEIKIASPLLMRKAIAFGFNVWIDPNGKGKNVLGINYPQTRMHEHMKNHRDQQEGQQQEKPKQLTPAQMQKMRAEAIEKFNLRYLTGRETGKLINFDKEGMKDSYFGSGDINAIVQMNDKGELIYEAVIPLKEVFKNPKAYLSKEKPFSLIFQTGSYEQRATASSMSQGIAGGESMRQMAESYYGGGGDMGEGIGGAGARMGMYGGEGAAMAAMADPVRYKIKRVVLFQMNQ